jgi:hypothetical protein
MPTYQAQVIVEFVAEFSALRQLFKYHDIVSYIIYFLLEVTVLV